MSARQCELALLWAMERLGPEERAVFLLRDALELGYSEIAAAVGKSGAACRQIVSRARGRVRAAGPRFHAPTEEVKDPLTRFAMATAAGDAETALRLLAPDALALTDGGGKANAARRPIRGAADIAAVFAAMGKARARRSDVDPGSVPRFIEANGQPALAVLGQSAGQDMVMTLAPDA